MKVTIELSQDSLYSLTRSFATFADFKKLMYYPAHLRIYINQEYTASMVGQVVKIEK
jgi:hypothetical protein